MLTRNFYIKGIDKSKPQENCKADVSSVANHGHWRKGGLLATLHTCANQGGFLRTGFPIFSQHIKYRSFMLNVTTAVFVLLEAVFTLVFQTNHLDSSAVLK